MVAVPGTRRAGWLAQLVDLGLPRLARVGVALPDDALVHIGFLATELAGLTAVAVGARSRPREAGDLLARTNTVAVVTHDASSSRRAAGAGPVDRPFNRPDRRSRRLNRRSTSTAGWGPTSCSC